MGLQARAITLIDCLLLILLAVAPMRHGLEIPALLVVGGISAVRLVLRSTQRMQVFEMTGWLASMIVWMPCALNSDVRAVSDSLSVSLGILIPLSIGRTINAVVLRRLLWCFVALDLVIAVSTAWQAATGYDLLFSYPKVYGWKLSGPFPYVYMDTLVFLYIAAGWWIYSSRPSSWCAKVLFGFYLAINIAMLIGSGTRSAILQMGTTFVIAYALTSRVGTALKAAAIGCALAVGIGWAVYVGAQFNADLNTLVNRFEILFRFVSSGESANADIRWFIWKDLIQVWQEYPFHFLFGQGFGTMIDYNKEIFGKAYLVIDDAQNFWMDVVYSVGVVGLIVLVCHSIAFGRYLLERTDSNSRRIIIFLLAWWVSPLSVQHKLMDVWYNINIALVVVAAVAISNVSRGVKTQ